MYSLRTWSLQANLLGASGKGQERIWACTAVCINYRAAQGFVCTGCALWRGIRVEYQSAAVRIVSGVYISAIYATAQCDST